jgi:hypothetical protein
VADFSTAALTLNEAYVKARYSKHFAISAEALDWIEERTALLLELIKEACLKHIEALERRVAWPRARRPTHLALRASTGRTSSGNRLLLGCDSGIEEGDGA